MAYRRGGDSYRGSWGSDFSFEPLNVYKEKEQERAKQLVQTASEQKYGTDIPPIPGGVFGVVQRSFNSAMAQTADLKAKAPAQPQQPKSRRGPFGVVSNFLGNVGDVGEAINDALPTPVRNVREIVSDLNPVEGVARSVNDVVHGRNPITRRFNEAKRVAGDVLSGEQFLGELGVDSSKLPDKPTMPLRQLADVAASPLTLVTAGTAGVARAGAQAGAKAITGAVLRQLGKEAVSGTVGYVAGQQASEHLPEGTPGIVKAGVGLGAGILAGGAAYKAIENPSRALQLSMNAAKAPGPLKGLSIEDVTGGKPLMREDLARLPHEQVTERPDLFQARDVPEGMTVDPKRVRNIVENYDPNKLEPGLVVHDSSTGQYVVLRGHHRLEAQRQLSQTGKVGPEGTWQIIDADLSNPEHVAQLKDLAITSNYGTAATNIREDVRAYKGLKGIGQDNQTIEGKLRKTQQEVQDLEHLSTLPEDLLDRVNQSPASAGNAAEIAGAVKRYDLTETDLRALMGRYGPEAPKAGLSRTELRRRLEQVGRVLQEENATKMQGGFESVLGGEAGASWDATKSHVIDLIDQMADHESNLSSQRARLRRLDNQLKDLADDPEIAAEVAQVRGRVQGKITELEAQLEQARNDYANARKARIEGNDVGPGTRSGVPEGDGNGGAANPGTQGAEAPAGPVTRTTEPPPVGARIRVNGVEGEVTATSPEGVRVKVDGGGEQWFAAGKDMFGTETVFEILPTSPKMDLGGTRENGGTKPPPTNQERMPDTTPGIDPEAVARRRAAAGRTSRPPESAVGEPARQIEGTPPPPATPEPPAPGEPGPGNPQRAFGQEDQPVDLLRGKPRDQLLNTATNEEAGFVGRARARAGRARNAATKLIRTEKNRTDHTVTELPARQAEDLRTRAQAAGLNVVQDGDTWVLDGFSAKAPIEDVVEQTTDAGRRVYAELNDTQRAVIDEVQRVNLDWNKTIEAHGGTVPKTENEGFWPRKVIAREVDGGQVPKNTSEGGYGKRVLGAAGIRKRTQASVEVGREAGVVYDNPWTALEAGMRNKARIAQDSYLKSLIEPLAVDNAKAGFGFAPVQGHPALTRSRVVGTSEGGAAIMTQQPMVFENSVAKDIRAIFEGNHAVNIPAVRAINGLLTPLRATLDMSASLQQGLAALQKNPLRTLRNQASVVGSTLGKPEMYANAVARQEARGAQLLTESGQGTYRSALDYMIGHGLHWVSEGATEEQMFTNAIERIPGVGKAAKFADQNFARKLNADRFALANDALERAIKTGKTGAELSSEMEGAIKSVNRMTGWTSSGPSSIEAHALFAPRFFRSNIEQIASAFTKGGLEGRIAREHLARLTAIAVATTVVANQARGYNTDFNPTSPNFMRIRNVGGQDISPFGTFATLIRAAAQATGNPLTGEKPNPLDAAKYLGRSKASPLVGTMWSLFTGSNFNGEPFSLDTPADAAKAAVTVGKESLPFTAQGLIDTGIKGALPSAVGAQSSPLTPAEKRNMERDAVAARLFNGQKYGDLQASDKATVNQDAKVAALDKAAQQNALTKDNEGAKTAKFNMEFRSKMEQNDKFLAAGKDAAGKAFSGVDYRKAYQDAAKTLRDQIEGAGGGSGGDAEVSGYFDLYDQADLGNGQTDFDKLDRLQAEYVAAHPKVLDKLAKTVGAKDSPTMQRLRAAMAQAKEYYAIPQYRGMTAEQSDAAASALKQASALTSSGVVPSRDAAFARLVSEGKVTPEDVGLARRASRVGSNPERRAYLASHPDFAVFYKGAPDGAEVGQFAASSGGASSRPKLNLGGSRASGSKTTSRYRTAGGTRR